MGNMTQVQRDAWANLSGKKQRVMPWDKPGLSRVEKVIAFLEFLPITKGIKLGSNLQLLPGQRAFIERVYGRRPVQLAVRSEPRGNGKTGLVAGLALCHLLGPEAELRGECYSCAVDRRQAVADVRRDGGDHRGGAGIRGDRAGSGPAASGARSRWSEGPGKGSKYEALSPTRGAAMAWRRRSGPMTRWRRRATASCSMRCAPAMGKRNRCLGDHPVDASRG